MTALVYDIIKQKGTRREIGINDLITLDNRDKVYYFESGKVVVNTYVNKVAEKEKYYYFFTPEAGDFIFGLDIDVRNSKCGLNIEAYERSVIYELSYDDILSYASTHTEELVEIMDHWVKHLIDGVVENNLNYVPSTDKVIREGKELKVKKGYTLSSKKLLWCTTEHPKNILFAGSTELTSAESQQEEKYYFPLAKSSFVSVAEAVTISAVSTEELVEHGGIWGAMYDFYGLCLNSEYDEIIQNAEEERKRIEKKYKAENDVLKQRFQGVKEILDGEGDVFDFEEGDEGVKDPFFIACNIVAKNQKIKLVVPNDYNKSENQIDDICRYSQIRYREILLESGWSKYQGGPMVGAMAGSEEPVAIIPHKNKSYIAYNPQTKKSFKITNKSEKKIDKIAYSLYEPLPNKPITLKLLLKFAFSTEKFDFRTVILMGLIGSILGLVTPVIAAALYDYIIPNAERSQLIFIALAIFMATMGRMTFRMTRSFALLRIETRSDHRLQAAVWDRLLNLPSRFFTNYTAGDLANRSMGIMRIRALLSEVAISSVLSFVFSLLNFVLLFYYSVYLSLWGLVLAIVYAGTMLAFSRWQIAKEKEALKLGGKLSGVVFQLFNGIPKFKTTGTEIRAFSHWLKHINEVSKAGIKAAHIGNLQSVVNSSFKLITRMVIYTAIIMHSDNEHLSTGQFLSFYAAYGAFVGAMLDMSGSMVSIMRIFPLYDRTRPILEEVPENSTKKKSPGNLKGEIELNHIKFRYDPDSPDILQDISMHIEPGDFVALVGESGSGKSTMVRLLLGFETPSAGTILYDKQDMKKLDTRMVRRQIGVVLQDGMLMPGDIFSNIVGSSTTLTHDDAWEAAEAASFAEDVKKMPMGMHTMVSEGAGTLSGGQRQRLMIARAIVHKPKILIFDEATSALDNKTQAEITESLNALQVTRIVIAHRLSTIKAADKIFYLEEGKIIESGSFDELMAIDGKFKKLAERQM